MADRSDVVFPADVSGSPKHLPGCSFFADSSDSCSTNINLTPADSTSTTPGTPPDVPDQLMQQIGQLNVQDRIPDLLPRRRVPYPDEIVDGLNRINDTLAECIAMSERVLDRSGKTFPHGLKNAAADYSGRAPTPRGPDPI
ncbi:hypothetical protein OsI_01422 [Oryza sativa Indica Group]|uniref:Uncharacterized protein n=1 Tax=Oryza sativa subsp. indica TaxID=39946 RepID=A2WNJ4_ORYSI|nr:hypothetical protein OsI_01422 [Oryza sativa Indica Group]